MQLLRRYLPIRYNHFKNDYRGSNVPVLPGYKIRARVTAIRDKVLNL